MSGVHDDLATLREAIINPEPFATSSLITDAVDRVEAEIARLQDGLRKMNDLLFGTWEDDSPLSQRFAEAESVAHALRDKDEAS